MGFDGLDTAVEFFGNLGGTEAKSDQVQHFKLAFDQARGDAPLLRDVTSRRVKTPCMAALR